MSKSSKRKISFMLALLLVSSSFPVSGAFQLGSDTAMASPDQEPASPASSYTNNMEDGSDASLMDVDGVPSDTSIGSTASYAGMNGQLLGARNPDGGNEIFYFGEMPDVANGTFEANINIDGGIAEQFGIITRYKDLSHYSLIARDQNGWIWDGFNGGGEVYGDYSNPTAKLEAGRTYALKVAFNEDTYEVYLDGDLIYSQTSDDALPTEAGKIGFRSYYSAKTIHIDDVKVTDNDSGQVVYTRDFNSDATPGLNMASANAAVPTYSFQTAVPGLSGKIAKLTTTSGTSQVVDTASPLVSNGSYSAKFQLDGDYSYAGLMFRYKDANNWSAVQNDSDGSWKLVGKADGNDVSADLTSDAQPLALGTVHDVSIDYAGDLYTLTVDGSELYSGTETGFSLLGGRSGFEAGSASTGTAYFDDLSVSYQDGDVYIPPQETTYLRNYDDGVTGVWNKTDGTPLTPAPAIADNKLVINNFFADVYDQSSLPMQDGTYTVKFRTDGKAGRLGFIFRYFSPSKPFASIYYDNSGHWGWQTDAAHYGDFTSSGPDIVADTDYTLKIKYIGQSVKVWLNDVLAFSGSADFPVGAGRVGIKSWNYPKKVIISQLSQQIYVAPTPPTPTAVEPITISSDKLSVSMDNRFPAVRSYTWLGSEVSDELQAQSDFLYAVNINGNDSIATVNSAAKTAENTIVYNLDVPVVDDNTEAAVGNVNMDVTFTVNGSIVDMKTHINSEPEGYKTRSVAFPNQKLVSVSSANPDAQGAAAWVTGAWNVMNDEFYTNDAAFGTNLQSQTPGSRLRTYGFVSDGKLAATIMNDVVETASKVMMNIETEGDEENKQLSMWNGAWTVRGDIDDDALFPPLFDFSSKIMISPDANNDGTADWKDAAIAFRDVWSQDLHPGADEINNYVSYIAMNFNSLTQNPYLRTLDNAKKLYNLYDGFGQLILEKGYEAEGHDDSHPDVAGHFGIREGGLKDFNALVDEGLKYNVKVGVHTNIDAQDPDAYYAKPENWSSNSSNYDWVDPTYPTDRSKDITSGELERRYTQLKQEVPNLAMVYDDVYSGAGWHANQFADLIQNKLGFWFGTEFSGPMEQNVIWTHWGTDPYYPSQTPGSLIIRFIKNQYQDTFQAPSPYTSVLLRGMLQAGVGTWQGRTDIQNGIDLFYNNNLLTKYMQHFPIEDIQRDSAGIDSKIVFGGGVVAQMDEYHASPSDENYLVGTASLTKNGKTIAKYDVLDHKDQGDTGTGQLDVINQKSQLFLPWDPQNESKIYYWNPKGGSTTWDLPDSWSGLATVEMYKLTDTGRVWDRTLNVMGDQVTIDDTTIGVPYVVYKSKTAEQQADVQQAGDFGVGGPLKDPGFDSGAFASWNKTSASNASASNVSVEHDYLKNSFLKITGGEDATVSQTVTGLKPGKTYTASVWVDINNGPNQDDDDTAPSTSERNVSISVQNYGGPAVMNTIDSSQIMNLEEPSKFKNTYYQRLKVDFTADALGKADIVLKADAAEDSTSNVWFDDVKLWENPGVTNFGSHYFYEDFENVSEGYGPFMFQAAWSGNQTHLAEKASDAKKAADPNITQPMTYAFDGNFSLKSNEQDYINNPATPLVSEILGTVPSTLKLLPHKSYKVGLKYQVNKGGLYQLSAKSRSGGPTVSALLSEQTGAGISNIPDFTLPTIRSTGTAEVELEFNTGDYSDYYLAIESVKATAQPNLSAIDVVMVVDDLYVDDLSTQGSSGNTGGNSGGNTGGNTGGGSGASGTTNEEIQLHVTGDGAPESEVTVDKNTNQIIVDFSKNANGDIAAAFSAKELLAAAALNQDAQVLLVNKDFQYPLSLDVLTHISGLNDFIAANQTTLSDLKLTLSVHKLDSETVLNGSGMPVNHDAVSSPFEVNLVLSAPNGKAYKVEDFDGLRSFFIKIDNSFKGQPLSALVMEKSAQGNLIGTSTRTVKQVVIDGQLYAEVHTATHSIYTIITSKGTVFKDLDKAKWAKDSIEEAAARLLVAGRGNGIYAPAARISRAEYVTMLVNALGLAATDVSGIKLPYSDVAAKPGVWPYNQLAIAYKIGLLNFVSGSKLLPNQPITRAEIVQATAAFAAYVNKAAVTEADNSVLSSFSDAASVNAASRAAFAWSVANQVMLGIKDTATGAITLSPNASSNRAQAAAILLRACKAVGLI
ncbi:S-layer family protein [Paenibacillus taihuensis]|uniref:S-layer family protein n=1 Tax=Paenibacillus taihuensis TaxID=1156355 RepID=A0A3D9SCW7_9BACL|nr:endo-alpha-N-acetylgalactosaminidase family protein [Paenibacillus taihuensis]REE92706.1 S-layer family protein [Paenibacillus taihuensis]